jgi:hypothetical protein
MPSGSGKETRARCSRSDTIVNGICKDAATWPID